MHSFINWLIGLPPASQVVLVAPVISLATALIVAVISACGLMFQIRHENRRFERRLEHEQKQKREERQMDMKREAFMIVCEALALGSQFLTKFADQEMPPEKHQQIVSEILPRLNRVHLIANDSTLAALTKNLDVFVRSNIELEALRIPLRQKRVDFNQTNNAIAQQQQMEQEIVAKLAEIGDSQLNDLFRQYLMQQLDATRTKICELLAQGVALNREMMEIHMDLSSKAFHAAMNYENYSTKAILAMRAELGFPIDAEKYEKDFQTCRDNQIKLVDGFIADVKTQIEANLRPVQENKA